MTRGSIYTFLHKQRGAFKLPTLLKVAIDVSKGMSYLHQNNIIHRDLKTANLLMDEHGVSRATVSKSLSNNCFFLMDFSISFHLLLNNLQTCTYILMQKFACNLTWKAMQG